MSRSGPLARATRMPMPSISMPGVNEKSPGAAPTCSTRSSSPGSGAGCLLDPRRVELEADGDVARRRGRSAPWARAARRACPAATRPTRGVSSVRSSFGCATRTRFVASCCSRPSNSVGVEQSRDRLPVAPRACARSTPSTTAPIVALPHGAREQILDRVGADDEARRDVDDRVEHRGRDRAGIGVLGRAVDRERASSAPPSAQRAPSFFELSSTSARPSSTRRPPGGAVPTLARAGTAAASRRRRRSAPGRRSRRSTVTPRAVADDLDPRAADHREGSSAPRRRAPRTGWSRQPTVTDAGGDLQLVAGRGHGDARGKRGAERVAQRGEHARRERGQPRRERRRGIGRPRLQLGVVEGRRRAGAQRPSRRRPRARPRPLCPRRRCRSRPRAR